MTGRFWIPSRRPGKRFYRYRPGKGGRMLQRNRLFRSGLLILSAFFLLLYFSVEIRSARTARRNEAYVSWRNEAENAAGTFSPTASVRNTAEPQLARMGMPDGTPIMKTSSSSSGQPAAVSLLGTKYHTVSGDQRTEMRQLSARNRDLAAWLTIDQVLDLPVVYRDNRFYLNHDFDGHKSASGTLFLDEFHPLKESTQVLLIHGHNMKDGSMFARLTHYQNKDYWRKHPFIHLTTLWEKEEYVIFAVIRVSTDPSDSNYLNWFSQAAFASEEQFGSYISQVRACSRIPCWLSVESGDALLELSTCVGEERLVVFARRIRANETFAGLRKLIDIGGFPVRPVKSFFAAPGTEAEDFSLL